MKNFLEEFVKSRGAQIGARISAGGVSSATPGVIPSQMRD